MFRFGGDEGHVLEITQQEVRLILNLLYRCCPIELDVGDSKSPFYRRYIVGMSLTMFIFH